MAVKFRNSVVAQRMVKAMLWRYSSVSKRAASSGFDRKPHSTKTAGQVELWSRFMAVVAGFVARVFVGWSFSWFSLRISSARGRESALLGEYQTWRPE